MELTTVHELAKQIKATPSDVQNCKKKNLTLEHVVITPLETGGRKHEITTEGAEIIKKHLAKKPKKCKVCGKPTTHKYCDDHKNRVKIDTSEEPKYTSKIGIKMRRIMLDYNADDNTPRCSTIPYQSVIPRRSSC